MLIIHLQNKKAPIIGAKVYGKRLVTTGLFLLWVMT